MKIHPHIPIIILLCLSLALKAQDAHLTNYRTVSNFFNPALTGDFTGHLKIQATTRTQYERTYEQGIIGFQSNIFSPINKKHWIGVGLNFIYDHAGSLSLDASGGDFLVGYHIPMGKKQLQTLSFCGSFGFSNLSIDTKNYKSESTILGIADPDKQALNNLSTQIFSVNAGVYFKTIISKKNQLRAGISVIRLNSPKFRVLGTTNNDSWGSRTNAFASYSLMLNKMIRIEPAMYYSHSENQNNINLQMLSEWKLSQAYHWSAMLGIAHRWDESFDLITGYKAQQLYISLSFDILSAATSEVLRNPGAIELGAYYIIVKNLKPTVKPIIFCPKL